MLRATVHENLVLPLDLAGHEPKATWAGGGEAGRSPGGGGTCPGGRARGAVKFAERHWQTAIDSKDEEQASKWKQKVEKAKQEVKEAEQKFEKAKQEVKEAEQKVEKAKQEVEARFFGLA